MINLENLQKKITISDEFQEQIRKVSMETLINEKITIDSEINIYLVDNEHIRKINLEYRQIDKDTDCLSFPLLSYEKDKVFKEQYLDFPFSQLDFNESSLMLGDVMISVEKALDQSREFYHKFERELLYLLVHSILHLLGYDHMNEFSKLKMRKAEEDVLIKLNVSRDLE